MPIICRRTKTTTSTMNAHADQVEKSITPSMGAVVGLKERSMLFQYPHRARGTQLTASTLKSPASQTSSFGTIQGSTGASSHFTGSSTIVFVYTCYTCNVSSVLAILKSMNIFRRLQSTSDRSGQQTSSFATYRPRAAYRYITTSKKSNVCSSLKRVIKTSR